MATSQQPHGPAERMSAVMRSSRYAANRAVMLEYGPSRSGTTALALRWVDLRRTAGPVLNLLSRTVTDEFVLRCWTGMLSRSRGGRTCWTSSRDPGRGQSSAKRRVAPP